MRKGYSDPGFKNEAEIGLNDLVRSAYRQTDIVVIGDGGHTKMICLNTLESQKLR